jgi:hypothetical protein
LVKDSAAFTRLFDLPTRNHDAICLGLFDLAFEVARRLYFPSADTRHEAIADATLYAIEQRASFRPAPGRIAVHYFGTIIYRRMRRRLKRQGAVSFSDLLKSDNDAEDHCAADLTGARPYARAS